MGAQARLVNELAVWLRGARGWVGPCREKDHQCHLGDWASLPVLSQTLRWVTSPPFIVTEQTKEQKRTHTYVALSCEREIYLCVSIHRDEGLSQLLV